MTVRHPGKPYGVSVEQAHLEPADPHFNQRHDLAKVICLHCPQQSNIYQGLLSYSLNLLLHISGSGDTAGLIKRVVNNSGDPTSRRSAGRFDETLPRRTERVHVSVDKARHHQRASGVYHLLCGWRPASRLDTYHFSPGNGQQPLSHDSVPQNQIALYHQVSNSLSHAR